VNAPRCPRCRQSRPCLIFGPEEFGACVDCGLRWYRGPARQRAVVDDLSAAHLSMLRVLWEVPMLPSGEPS